jgi:hypothetical protein
MGGHHFLAQDGSICVDREVKNAKGHCEEAKREKS